MLRLGLPGGDHGRQEFAECCGLTCIALAEIDSQRTYLLNRIDGPRRTRGASPARTDPTTLASMSAARSNVDKSVGGPKSDTSSRSVPGGGSGLLAADPARARNAPCHRPAPPPSITVRLTADTDPAATCQPTAGDMGHTGFAVRRASGVLLACVGMGTAWASGLAAANVAGGDAGHGDGPGCQVGRAGYRRQDGDGGPAVPGAAGARAGPGGVADGGAARGGEARSPCPARGRASCGWCARPRVGGGAR